jgi:hypothetical protein
VADRIHGKCYFQTSLGRVIIGGVGGIGRATAALGDDVLLTQSIQCGSGAPKELNGSGLRCQPEAKENRSSARKVRARPGGGTCIQTAFSMMKSNAKPRRSMPFKSGRGSSNQGMRGSTRMPGYSNRGSEA